MKREILADRDRGMASAYDEGGLFLNGYFVVGLFWGLPEGLAKRTMFEASG